MTVLPPLRRTAADAEAYARVVHAGQVDQAGRPYVEHLERVAGGLIAGCRSRAGSMTIEYVTGSPDYGEHRSRGWYVVSDETGECEGPFSTRREAEYAAGRPDDE